MANEKKYAFKKNFRCPVKPQVVGTALAEIEKEHGNLQPKTIVASSMTTHKELNPCFTWDNKVAGNLWREEEARELCRSVVIVYDSRKDDEPVVMQGWVSVTTEEYGQGYVSTTRIVEDESLAEQAVNDAIKGLNGWVARVAHLSGILKVKAFLEGLKRLQKDTGFDIDPE
jgi:hypothetical protein